MDTPRGFFFAKVLRFLRKDEENSILVTGQRREKNWPCTMSPFLKSRDENERNPSSSIVELKATAEDDIFSPLFRFCFFD